MILPQEYIVQKYYQYAGYPKFKRYTNTYEACCPICREGNSWGKKKRSYYLVEKNIVCCHNCGWYGSPFKWIQEVSGLSEKDILKESKNFDILPLDLLAEKEIPKINNIKKLPDDSINLFDPQQIEYYKNNNILNEALNLIKKRRLNSAINKPHTLWLSLTDKIHKNRLVIPFYNASNEIVFYQTRTILNNEIKHYPKYLSKVNSEKALYGLNNISPEIDTIFIFEGPLDAFFVKNGTAVCGIQENSNNMLSKFQEEQISTFSLYNRVWVLDNQWVDTASKKKTKKLIENNQSVFIWPESMKGFKDINDYCIVKNLNYISTDFILENTYSGLKAELALANINRRLI